MLGALGHRFGRGVEIVARLDLDKDQIAARRWKTPVGEIDIVARRRRDLVFVEVKARDDLDAAAEAVTERAKQRIIAAGEFWLASHPDDAQCFIRFDVILVAPGKLPRHIANAFDASR